MGNQPESDKAVRYIVALDDARCRGDWASIPEICRKVDKHCTRHCLTLTARSEALISSYNPETEASTATGLSTIIPSLLTAIENEGEHAQDAFQATVCLGWLHYVLDEPGLAIARLPRDIIATASRESRPLSGWSRVCIVKGAYLKGSSHDRTGAIQEAMHTYSAIVPWLSSIDIGSESPQFKMWTERLLVRLCQLCDQSSETGKYLEPAEALQAYRLWAKFWDVTGSGTGATDMARHRRSAWKAYYETLSTFLQNDTPYNVVESTSEGTAATEKPSSRLQQRSELTRVESIYESLLFKETHFPKANESNQEIEEWANGVMANWRSISGPNWSDEDVGEGGIEAVSRNVLDILYRAAMKTFHSTPILRHLFTVHASLAEFELAFKAFDSYVEIINRGKDRAEKSGEEDVGLDDDNTILVISAEAIRILCQLGSRKEAEKAVEISHNIEKWSEQAQHIKAIISEASPAQQAEPAIAPRALAVAYCAIGLSQAQWARFTYNADARTVIQTKAVQYLRRSLEPRFEAPGSIEALYALGLVLSEMRDIPGAIKVVKRALSSNTHQSSGNTDFGRERKLIPVWHLLALLLTARSEFSAAEKSCEAAFEQFGDPTVLFGKDEEYRSEHLNQANGTSSNIASGIVDQLEMFEKSGILQIKMTQLALADVVDGPTAAVDGSEELLALYSRLFGNQAAEQVKLQPPNTSMAPPKSAHGTIRGSIFRSRGSVKGPQKNTEKTTVARNSSIISSRSSTTGTQGTAAPKIQVTDENGADHAKNRQHTIPLFHHKNEEDGPTVSRTSSKLKKRSASSLCGRSGAGAESEQAPVVFDEIANGTASAGNSPLPKKSSRHPSMSSSIRKSMESSDRPARYTALNSPTARQPVLPSSQNNRLAAPFAGTSIIPCFTKTQSRRHKVSLLVDIWIFISGLYTQAHMYEDAKGAVSEALKLAEIFEAEIAQESSTSKAFANKGWGGGRSVEELWADAFAARGELHAAQALYYEAKADFERALLHYPDHPEAIVGLSNILLDIYAEVIPLEPNQRVESYASSSSATLSTVADPNATYKSKNLASHTPSAENQISPPELNRLAARDRAFGLLSTLTKLGTGWDYSEAWYALARAYEESGLIEKTKEVLWWCVELEDTRPVRSWKNVALGGFVL